MEPKLELFSSLCAAIGPASQEVRAAVWDCLSRYDITGTAASTSYADSLRAFLTAKQVDGLSQKTLKEYRRALTAAGAALGDRPPAEITTDHLRAYLAQLAARLSHGSVQTYTNILRSFFGWLHREGQLQRDPMVKIRSRAPDRQRTRRPLTGKELERTRRACRTPRDRALLELMVSTGCRVSEVCGIRRGDISAPSHSITVTGKGGKTRLVLFSARAELAMEEYLATAPASPWLFPGAGDGPLSVRAVQRAVANLGRLAMLPGSLHPHILRHTFATQAINRGMELPILQQLLGHAKPDTTEIYAKLSPATVARAYARAIA